MSKPVMEISECEILKLADYNKARELAGLDKMSYKIRDCLYCNRRFQSFGNRMCNHPNCIEARKIFEF